MKGPFKKYQVREVVYGPPDILGEDAVSYEVWAKPRKWFARWERLRIEDTLAEAEAYIGRRADYPYTRSYWEFDAKGREVIDNLF